MLGGAAARPVEENVAVIPAAAGIQCFRLQK
jgi:hypothetical protein